MKKLIVSGIGILLVLVIAADSYFSFPVKADESNLKECINAYYNRGYNINYSMNPQNNIKIYSSVALGKNKYILIEINEQLGRIILVKGMTGRYKIERLGYGGGNFEEGIVESKDKKYLLFGGRNIGLEIASVTFTLEGQNYTLEIPAEKRFLVHTEIDNRIQLTHMDLDSLKFYDAQGTDITERVDWNGASAA